MKAKERYQTDKEDLKSCYKFVCTCDNCGISYGRDSKKEQAHELCPFCERLTYMPRGARKKDEKMEISERH